MGTILVQLAGRIVVYGVQVAALLGFYQWGYRRGFDDSTRWIGGE